MDMYVCKPVFISAITAMFLPNSLNSIAIEIVLLHAPTRITSVNPYSATKRDNEKFHNLMDSSLGGCDGRKMFATVFNDIISPDIIL